MCILLVWDGMFCIHLLCSSSEMCHSRPLFPIFCLDDLSIDVNGMKFHIIIALLLISPFRLIFALYIWCSDVECIYIFFPDWPVSIMQFLCFLLVFVIKSTLSDMNIAILDFISIWRKYLFHLFTLSLCVSFSQKWVSCRHSIHASFFSYPFSHSMSFEWWI